MHNILSQIWEAHKAMAIVVTHADHTGL